MYDIDLILKAICFVVWLLGTLSVFWMGATNRIRTDAFNNVPWSQILKSPQHQVFLTTIMAFAMMFTIRMTQ